MTNWVWMIIAIYVIGITFPEQTIKFCQKVRQKNWDFYAKRYGKKAAEKHLGPRVSDYL